MKNFLASACLLLSLAASNALVGQGNGKGKGWGKGKEKGEAETVVVFTGKDRDVVREYFRGHPSFVASKGPLPKGLAKKLERGKPLPPGWRERMVALPVEVETYLPPEPPWVQRGYVDGSVVLLDTRSNLVIDVFVAF